MSEASNQAAASEIAEGGGRTAPTSAAAFRGIPETVTVDARLLIWLSPSFPVGAFAYSHGLELAADRGWVHNRDNLQAWLRDLVELGSLRNDLILLAASWRGTLAQDMSSLDGVNALALALQPSAERRLETVTQGAAFFATLASAWSDPALVSVTSTLTAEVAYPVAVGAGSAAHGIALDDTLQAYAIAFASNLVSSAIRLSIVGQTDGQRVLAALMPTLQAQAAAATSATLDDIGGATLRSDLASQAHETQYSRLFRS
jgi:urease accessory protein